MTVSFNDTLFGTSGNDSLYGDVGNDSLFGDIDTLVGLGNDTLNGGPGDDSLFGGYGNDIYIVDSNGDIVSESASTLNGGNDTVESSISYTLTSFVETLLLTGEASINGTGNDLANLIVGTSGSNSLYGAGGNDTLNAEDGDDHLYGGNGDDSLMGGVGNDVFDGGAGADSMSGGYGDDAYFSIDDAGDTVTEAFAAGYDSVESEVSFTLGDNVEELRLDGSALNGYGNGLDNAIWGSTSGNRLEGNAGNDTLRGGQGNDTLVGGEGDDELNGDSNTDILDGGAGNDSLEAFHGTATMTGGAGDDAFSVDSRDDLAIEAPGEGYDRVYCATSYRLGANIEELQIFSGKGTGNGLANFIFGAEGGGAVTLSGLAGNDTLWGGQGYSDVLLGGGGNDYLEGYGGDDTMLGGAGNDTYVVGSAGDLVVESTGHGNDTVESVISYTLGANLENLSLLSSAYFGMGNDGANAITGNGVDNLLGGGLGNDTLLGGYGNDILDGSDGNDSLVGGYGEDLMLGGAGDDVYVVDDTDDITAEDAGDGTDKVVNSVSWTLDDDFEQLVLTGGDAGLSGTGNGLANTLTGNAGSNTLDGKGGADTLIGGNGDDSYYVNAAGDVVTEAAGQGTDMINSSVSYSLANAANVENLLLTGAGAINGGGNALANTITGNSGANQLTGGTGHDTLVGGLGADSFRYAGTLANAHSDTINDFTHGTDHIDLDDALFTAIGAVGNLAAGAFKAATNITATGGNTVDASDRILYDSDSGNVYYDADGSGAGARVLIFNLAEHPTLTASDIRVI